MNLGLRILISLIFILAICLNAYATHNRAGEISYKHVSGYTWEITITTYTKYSSIAADRDSLPISWGDGTSETIARTSFMNMGYDIKLNEYKAQHTYPGPSLYIIRMEDPNRNADVLNIPNSVNVSFFIETALNFVDPQVFGVNNSPVLLNPPMDFANINTPYIHNPAAYDPDGDSLVYALIDCKGNSGQAIAGYSLPDQISPGANNNISINSITGDVLWNSPKQEGEYNIAILITEYRNGIVVGSMIRDMQIIVLDHTNEPPDIKEINDTCVVAGSTLLKTIYASDINGDSVFLDGSGGPLEFGTNPATFPDAGSTSSTSSIFEWVTSCEDIRRNPYSIIFKAKDNYSPGWMQSAPLTDLETWRIWVVAPPPKNVIAEPNMNNIKVSWDSLYQCAGANHFKGFSVWRKEGSNPFSFDTCETGLAGKGYFKIADNITNYSYLDENLDRGKSYCYRVLAHFSLGTTDFPYNQTTSLPSNEACKELKQDIPLIIKVSVIDTDPFNGKIEVSWVKPKAEDLDTLQNPGPYIFEIYRSNGLTAQSLNLIETFSSNHFANIKDTSIIDSQINTINQPYSYMVRFKSNNAWIGDCPLASSILLNIEEGDNSLNLFWSSNTPWVNSQYNVYKRINSTTFDSIGTTSDTIFEISELANGQQYCYIIEGIGQYTDTTIISPLRNLSQENCGTPLDTIPPCPPEISVYNYCKDVPYGEWQNHHYFNEVSWSIPDSNCGDDIIQYNIYYKANENLPFESAYSLFDINDTLWSHDSLMSSVAGCYSVTAVDSYYNESIMSNEFCVDNCPVYNLPNVFTPNKDGNNDLYTPFLPYRFINHLDFKVYNRWGNLVFETQNPMIDWNGYSSVNGEKLQNGLYFYSCEIYEKRISGVVQKAEPLKGWIQIFR